MIEIRQLTKVFKLSKKQMAEAKTKNPRKTAVDHLDLTAKEGEIYGPVSYTHLDVYKRQPLYRAC